MSLSSQPGYDPRDLRTIQPLAAVADDDEFAGYTWQPVGAPMKVISIKLNAAEFYNQGKRDQDYSYVLWADFKPGTTFRINERMRVWHPEVSHRKTDGSLDATTGMEVDSVVTYRKDGIARLDCHRNE